MPARDFLLVFQQKYRFNKGEATVFCPVCQDQRLCKQKEYWRCILAKSIQNVKLSSYYKCQTCKSRFPTGVEFASMSSSRALEHALLVAMVRCRGANGRFQRKQARIVREALLKITQHEKNIKNTSLDGQGRVPSEDEIKLCSNHMKSITCQETTGLQEDIMPYMVEKLSEADKKLVIRGMASVTIQKKKLQPKEAKMIEQVGNILGLDSATVQEVTSKEQ